MRPMCSNPTFMTTLTGQPSTMLQSGQKVPWAHRARPRQPRVYACMDCVRRQLGLQAGSSPARSSQPCPFLPLQISQTQRDGLPAPALALASARNLIQLPGRQQQQQQQWQQACSTSFSSRQHASHPAAAARSTACTSGSSRKQPRLLPSRSTPPTKEAVGNGSQPEAFSPLGLNHNQQQQQGHEGQQQQQQQQPSTLLQASAQDQPGQPNPPAAAGPGSSSTSSSSPPPAAAAEGEGAADEQQYSPAVQAALNMLRFYKQAMSPLMAPACRFLPTCSEYAMDSYKQYGVAKGTVLTAWRLARCNPWGGSGYDPTTWPPPSLGWLFKYDYTAEVAVVLGVVAFLRFSHALLFE